MAQRCLCTVQQRTTNDLRQWMLFNIYPWRPLFRRNGIEYSSKEQFHVQIHCFPVNTSTLQTGFWQSHITILQFIFPFFKCCIVDQKLNQKTLKARKFVKKDTKNCRANTGVEKGQILSSNLSIIPDKSTGWKIHSIVLALQFAHSTNILHGTQPMQPRWGTSAAGRIWLYAGVRSWSKSRVTIICASSAVITEWLMRETSREPSHSWNLELALKSALHEMQLSRHSKLNHTKKTVKRLVTQMTRVSVKDAEEQLSEFMLFFEKFSTVV